MIALDPRLLAPVIILGLGLVFHGGLAHMVGEWGTEEYNYAYLIPPLTLWLLWQRRAEIAVARSGRGAWWGVVVVALGLTLGLFGEISTIWSVKQYGFLVTVWGLALVLVGGRAFRVAAPSLAYLLFMVPLPALLYLGLSAKLQLVSSALGVAVIRALGISVFLEGNIIDLGSYRLQVVEACSGLRYLFPLLSFGYLCGLLYKGPAWHKLVLLAATVPITIVVNSVRIGITGALVEYGGIAMAEGFLHFFEGWIIFFLALALLFALMALLARLGGGRLGDRFDIELLWPPRPAGDAPMRRRPGVAPLLAATGGVVLAALAAVVVPQRAEIIPAHQDLATFPLELGAWRGRRLALEPIYVAALKFDDYVLADYAAPAHPAPVNLYVAYYGSQRKDASIHSPRHCLPGGGYEITSLARVVVPGVVPGLDNGVAGGGGPVVVNRAIIAKGVHKQIVYYWFEQRGRRLTNEFAVKLLLFWDALTRNRTDGALVRLVTEVRSGESADEAEVRLAAFVGAVLPPLARHLPQ